MVSAKLSFSRDGQNRKQVTATDGDKDRPQNIVYFLTGQGIDPDNPANSKFDINRTSGDIFVLKVGGTNCWKGEAFLRKV